jgi:hypothetical protein
VFTITFCKRLLTDAREVSVLQLQLLDLMIRREEVAVPINTTARTELIDLMARILVAVFQAEGAGIHDGAFVQPEDQAGARGPQGHRLLTAIEREAGTGE